MEQFVFVAVSLYNTKNLTTLGIAKQDLPKYETEQNHTYQIDSIKKRRSKNLFAKADSLVDKIFSSPHIKLSESQTLLLYGEETWVLLSDMYLLDAAGIAPTLVLNQYAEAEDRKLFPFQNLNVRRCNGCTRKAVLLMGLYAVYWKLATYQYQKWDNFCIKTFVHKVYSCYAQIQENEGICHVQERNLMFGYVDKLAKDNNGAKPQLVRQDLFGRTVDTKGMKTEVSKGTIRAIFTMIT